MERRVRSQPPEIDRVWVDDKEVTDACFVCDDEAGWAKVDERLIDDLSQFKSTRQGCEGAFAVVRLIGKIRFTERADAAIDQLEKTLKELIDKRVAEAMDKRRIPVQ